MPAAPVTDSCWWQHCHLRSVSGGDSRPRCESYWATTSPSSPFLPILALPCARCSCYITSFLRIFPASSILRFTTLSIPVDSLPRHYLYTSFTLATLSDSRHVPKANQVALVPGPSALHQRGQGEAPDLHCPQVCYRHCAAKKGWSRTPLLRACACVHVSAAVCLPRRLAAPAAAVRRPHGARC